MGSNLTRLSPTFGGEEVLPISFHQERSSETRAELEVGNYALSKRNYTHPQLDWERWQQQQFQQKPIRRTSSQHGYRPRSASLRRLRYVQRRRFLNIAPSKKTAKMEAALNKLQEEIALLAACARGDVNKVEQMVDSGVDVNSSDQNQMTALHYAAMHTRDGVIKSLISRGAEVVTADLKGGFSAIHWVVTNAAQKRSSVNHLEGSLTALTKAGCSVNATDFNNATPLHIAAQKGNKDAVHILLRLGADPNKVDITERNCFEVAKNEQMRIYIKTLFYTYSKKDDQLESRHIYHILEPPLPSIPSPLPSYLSAGKSSHEEQSYRIFETSPPLQRHCQYTEYTMESHLYHLLVSTQQ